MGCYTNTDGGDHVITRTLTFCKESSNINYIIGDPENPGNGGGIVTPSDPTPIVTQPLLLFAERAFVNGLSVAQKQWWENALNANAKQTILDYLKKNPNEEEFSKELINECIAENLDEENAKSFIIASIIEDKIDDSLLDECTKGILDKLKNLQQNDIVKIITKLGNVDSLYKVKIISVADSELNWNELAVTNWQTENGSAVPYNYSIKIKNSFTSVGTDLGIASTILHELVHAYFLSLIDDCHYQNNCEQLQAFPEVWNYYVQHTSTNGGSQHEQLAQSYVNILATALQEFHTGTSLTNGQQPLQLYTDLAWGGLQGTVPYQALSSSDIFRINKTDAAENYNQPQYNITGTALEYFPQGTPCP